jgi:hypothetical protein
MAIPSIKSLLPDIVATYYLSLGVPKDRLNSIVYDDPEKIMMTLKSTLTELHKEAPPRDAIVNAFRCLLRLYLPRLPWWILRAWRW